MLLILFRYDTKNNDSMFFLAQTWKYNNEDNVIKFVDAHLFRHSERTIARELWDLILDYANSEIIDKKLGVIKCTLVDLVRLANLDIFYPLGERRLEPRRGLKLTKGRHLSRQRARPIGASIFV